MDWTAQKNDFYSLIAKEGRVAFTKADCLLEGIVDSYVTPPVSNAMTKL